MILNCIDLLLYCVNVVYLKCKVKREATQLIRHNRLQQLPWVER